MKSKFSLSWLAHQGDRAHHQGQCHQKGQEPDKTVGALLGLGAALGRLPLISSILCSFMDSCGRGISGTDKGALVQALQ